jgi:hypothetical protein
VKRSRGADLVIPALALGFAIYFFVSIADLAWEAKANGLVIGSVLVLLIAIQLVRIGLELGRGTSQLRFAELWEPRDALGKRLGMVAITVLFIATIHWSGLTLGLLAAMAAALWIMGARGKVLILLPLSVALAAYLLFVVLLKSDIPHGPFERLFS